MSNNLIGKRFGRLTVINDTVERKENGSIVWKCLCDCGNEKLVTTAALNSGSTQSCGCLYKETRKNFGNLVSERNKIEYQLAAKHELYSSYKYRAGQKNWEFNLTLAEFIIITSMNCHYCGVEPLQEVKSNKTFNGNYQHNGIDRIDSSLGYSIENCVPCCEICNKAKRDLSYNDFINWINRLIEFRNVKC